MVPAGREVLDATSSAADGSFELLLPEDWLARQAYKRAEFFVYLPGHGLYAEAWTLAELPVGQPLSVALERLERENQARIRVLDEFDEPVAAASVSPGLVRHPTERRLELPLELFDGVELRTDEEGWVTLDVPPDDLAGIRVVGAGEVPVRLQIPWQEDGPFPEEVRLYGPRPWDIDTGELDVSPTVRVRSFVNAPRTEGLRHQLNGHAYETGTPVRIPAAADVPRTLHFALLGGPEILSLSLRTVDDSETLQVLRGDDPYEVALSAVDAETGAPLEGRSSTSNRPAGSRSFGRTSSDLRPSTLS